MPFTFGSVGDVITLGLLIRDVIKCLDDSRGSSAEYQAVIRELWSLDHALLEVELLLVSSQQSTELNALRETALRIAEKCEACISAFRDRVRKYRGFLGSNGSGDLLGTAVRKFRWAVSEKESLARFRAEIIAHCLSLNMLVASAGVYVTAFANCAS